MTLIMIMSIITVVTVRPQMFFFLRSLRSARKETLTAEFNDSLFYLRRKTIAYIPRDPLVLF